MTDDVKPRRSRTAILCVVYVLSVLVIVGITVHLGDEYWVPTVALFAPRWIHAVPIVLLLPLGALRGTRRARIVSLTSLAAAAAVLVWFNDVHVSMSGSGLVDPPPGPKLRVMSYNIGGSSTAASSTTAVLATTFR